MWERQWREEKISNVTSARKVHLGTPTVYISAAREMGFGVTRRKVWCQTFLPEDLDIYSRVC